MEFMRAMGVTYEVPYLTSTFLNAAKECKNRKLWINDSVSCTFYFHFSLSPNLFSNKCKREMSILCASVCRSLISPSNDNWVEEST